MLILNRVKEANLVPVRRGREGQRLPRLHPWNDHHRHRQVQRNCTIHVPLELKRQFLVETKDGHRVKSISKKSMKAKREKLKRTLHRKRRILQHFPLPETFCHSDDDVIYQFDLVM